MFLKSLRTFRLRFHRERRFELKYWKFGSLEDVGRIVI